MTLKQLMATLVKVDKHNFVFTTFDPLEWDIHSHEQGRDYCVWDYQLAKVLNSRANLEVIKFAIDDYSVVIQLADNEYTRQKMAVVDLIQSNKRRISYLKKENKKLKSQL